MIVWVKPIRGVAVIGETKGRMLIGNHERLQP